MKSYVTLEQRKCLVCGQDYDTNALLLDRYLRASFEHKTVTGWGLCPEHQKLYDDGYVALVGADESKSSKLPSGNIDPSLAYRTGEVAHLRFAAFDRIVKGMSGTDASGKRIPMMFCDPAVIVALTKIQKEATA